MINYIIFTSEFDPAIGGVTVLHKLCHLLNEQGQHAYLWPMHNNYHNFRINANYNTPLANETILNNSIVIYPEIVVGNPLNAKNVVRWILNIPGKVGGDGIFDQNDMIYYYSGAFVEKRQDAKILQLIELYKGLFKNKNMQRKGSCYVNRRNKNMNLIHDLSDSIEIKNITPSEELVNIFNKTEYFFSYDIASFLSLQAAMCGCISIVIPHENITKKEFFEQDELRKYGISYGMENIEHAVSTMHKVESHLEDLEKKHLESIKNFITETQEYFYKDKKNNFIRNENHSILLTAEKFIEDGKFNEARKVLRKMNQNSQNKLKIQNYLLTISLLDKKYQETQKIAEEILVDDNKNAVALDCIEYLTEIK